MTLQFQITAHEGNARTGLLHTAHGIIRTPAFMPVGTAGTVKGLTPDMVAATGADVVLGNTYHLMLRPGAERVSEMGGLHSFIQWDKPILTDSGGFQVMSLGSLCKLKEEGVTFASHIDGRRFAMPPERSIEIQHLLGSTITMVLDECTPYPATYDQARLSMERSMRWAERCKQAFIAREGYGLFGIQQGSVYPALREASARSLIGTGFDGYAIGGLAVGEGQEVMLRVLDDAVPMLPTSSPRYLMGVGKPSDLVEAVWRGIDMFDCVIPTRSGRFGRAYTCYGELNIRNACHASDSRPLQEDLPHAISRYSRAYLHHLFKADEMLGPILLSWHNLFYYQSIMQQMRDAIVQGNLAQWRETFYQRQSLQNLSPLQQ